MAIDGLSVVYVIAGFILAYSGVKNTTIKNTLLAFAKGQQPVPNPTGALSVGVQTVGSPGGSTSGTAPAGTTSSAIANKAVTYVGHAYLYGGAPGPNGTQPWDCSSFCNWVLGHDFDMTLPTDSTPGYNGATHGPTTLEYLVWHGATTVGSNPNDAQAGDLCVWQTHMGIATGGGNMVSALNPSLGTKVTTIPGGSPGGEVLFVRRLTG